MKSDIVDVEVYLHHETEKAILVSLDGEREGAVWLPKEAVEYNLVKGKIYEVSGPSDFLTEKGLT